MARSIFYGVGAFVGSITGPTTCTFWPDDPATVGWKSKQSAVDLAMNPEAVRRGTIAVVDLQADDFAGYGTGGLTKIGPMFPGGAMIGGLYLEEGYLAKIGLAKPGPRPYEWATLIYWDGPLAGRRFHGFHAQIRKNQGSLAMLSVWARGTSHLPNQTPMGTWWVDLGTDCHPVEAGITEIGVAQGNPQSGAVFIDHKAGGGGVIAFDGPKNPKSLGSAVARRAHHVR
jgi:hypothetical protein